MGISKIVRKRNSIIPHDSFIHWLDTIYSVYPKPLLHGESPKVYWNCRRTRHQHYTHLVIWFDCVRVATSRSYSCSSIRTRRWIFLYFHSHRRSSRQHMHTQTKQTQNYKLLFVRRFRDSVDSLPVQYTSLFDSKRILIYLFFVIFFHSLGEYFTQNSIFHSKSESRE